MSDHSQAAAGHVELSATELEALHVQDRQAAKQIVLLLTGVFLTGVALYSYVAYVVGSSTAYWIM